MRWIRPSASAANSAGNRRAPSRLNALESCVFGEPELPDAVVVHGRESGRQVEPPLIDLGDVSQHRGREVSFLGNECIQSMNEGGVTEVMQ